MTELPGSAGVPERWTRATVYPDMWLDPDDDPRERAGSPVGERETLLAYLHRYRQTLELKCEGLDAEQLARRSVPPSSMSLLGLVRHLADVEHHWFRRELSGDRGPNPYGTQEAPDLDWEGAVADPDVVAQAWASWRAEVAFAERYVEGVEDLGACGARAGLTVRNVLVHLIEEYARHCGHADLLRECVDGRVGQ